jgi:hypothetical protein
VVYSSALLDSRLDRLAVAPQERAQIQAQRSKLAAVETDDPLAHQAIKEAFVTGYRKVMWVATGLALVSSLTTSMLIAPDRRSVN